MSFLFILTFFREVFFIYEALKRYFLHYIKERLIPDSEGSTGKRI